MPNPDPDTPPPTPDAAPPAGEGSEGIIDYLLWHGMSAMAAEVRAAVAELRELRARPAIPPWSKERPTEPGLYLTRHRGRTRTGRVGWFTVVRGPGQRDLAIELGPGRRLYDLSDDVEWSGPLPLPPDPEPDGDFASEGTEGGFLARVASSDGGTDDDE